MKVYGLSGKSGTGKSYHAAELCASMGIESIIDDGLFIYNDTIVAGISAKKQPTIMGAVKTAIFTKPDHAKQVTEAIKSSGARSVLILGTSDEMVEKIAAKLQLPSPEKIIHIEDIASPKEIRKARRYRKQHGMHVIPAPTMQVRKQFSGYFLDPKRGFKRSSTDKDLEKTIVRPTFSYIGNFIISDKAIEDIVQHIGKMCAGVADVLFVTLDNSDEGMYLRVIVRAEYGIKLKNMALDFQKRIKDEVSAMTDFNILGVAIDIREFKVKSLKK